MQENNLRYLMYCRKSEDHEDRQIQSIDDQKRELNLIAKNRSLNIVKVFSEAQSAKKPGRHGFNEMLAMLQQGKADGIICWKINRLARNPIDGGQIQWNLQQRIIKSIVTPYKEYLPTDNVLMMAVELGMATQYSLDLGNDIRRGMDTKVQKGWRPHTAPLGYLNDKAGLKGNRQIFKDPERFDLVRKMWSELLTGMYTVKQIVDLANEEWGLRTRKNEKLSVGTAYKIFTNSFYYGEYLHRGEIFTGKHEPLISKMEFDLGQRILGRAGKPRPKYKRLPFTGIIQCGECGSMFTADEKYKFIKGENRTKQLIYHRCTKSKKDIACTQKPIKYEDLVSQAKAYLDTITIPPEFLSWAIHVLKENNKLEEKNRSRILANHQKNYQGCLKRIDNLINLYVSAGNTDRELLSEEEYKSQKNALMTEKGKIETEMQKIGQDINQWVDLTEKTFHFATYAKIWFDKGDFQQKTQILRAIGKNLTIKDGKLQIDLQKPLIILKNGLESELLKNAILEPSVQAMDKRENTPLGGAYFSWSTLVMDVRTAIQALNGEFKPLVLT